MPDLISINVGILEFMWYSKDNIELIWLPKKNARFMSNRLRIIESMWSTKENIEFIVFEHKNDKLMSIYMRMLEYWY